MTKQILGVLAIAACVLTAACSTNVARFQMPGTDLAYIRTFYIRPPADDPAELELYALIRSDLQARGYHVLELDGETRYGETDTRIEYTADWDWDFTAYLLELRVAIYDPDDNTLIAQAQSLQSSLARKTNEVIVERTIAILFEESIPTSGAN